MRYLSTRGQAPPASFSEALLAGLAPDGGLYVPESFPSFDPSSFDPAAPIPELASEILTPFVDGDPLGEQISAICRRAFDFPMPLVPLARDTSVLELFHGPTAAFKDFGARFLAHCFERLLAERGEVLTVLVATSGDTGAAVAAACHLREGIRVGVLFPKGGVAPRQEQQLTCWDRNVSSFAVRGNFDDCQRVVKDAFTRGGWPPSGGLSSANSINVGRLLPQAVYYGIASMRYVAEHGAIPGVIVPSGNVGNAVGAFWAKTMGFPIRHIAMASNENRVVPDWFESGSWDPRPSKPTLANAMDVGDPSNMERLFHLYPERRAMIENSSSMEVDDATIRKTIAAGIDRWGQVWCPHTATAVHFREQMEAPHWIVVATAHPAKFDSIVEPLIGRDVPVPPGLVELLARPTKVTEIDAAFEPMAAELDGASG